MRQLEGIWASKNEVRLDMAKLEWWYIIAAVIWETKPHSGRQSKSIIDNLFVSLDFKKVNGLRILKGDSVC